MKQIQGDIKKDIQKIKVLGNSKHHDKAEKLNRKD